MVLYFIGYYLLVDILKILGCLRSRYAKFVLSPFGKILQFLVVHPIKILSISPAAHSSLSFSVYNVPNGVPVGIAHVVGMDFNL
jgi:hypothetical protein